MSEIFINEQVTDEVKRRALGADTPILEVRRDTKTKKLVFIGYDGLVRALENGAPVEEYLMDKIAKVRKAMVKEN